jgi:arylsulfatase A-like enzyme
MEWAKGFPNYSTMLPRTTATFGEVLKDNGYATWWFGKNHNTPDWETTVAGPFDRWPTGMGFEYFYGFNAGETHQYYPVIFENTTPVEPDKSPKQGYHFMTDMTDRAIARMKFSKSVAPSKPFFMYFAPVAMHAPHHVTAEWRRSQKAKCQPPSRAASALTPSASARTQANPSPLTTNRPSPSPARSRRSSST